MSFTQEKIRNTEKADCEHLTSLGRNVLQSVGALSDGYPRSAGRVASSAGSLAASSY